MNSQAFGKYQLVKKLATGGMAEVWLARQTGIEGFQKLVVVKRILPHLADDPEFVQMFLNEAKIAARFNHPNIAQIHDLGEINGQYFIAMEFIHGEDLGRVMRKAWSKGQWIARPLSIRIVASACEGLHYAHAKADESGRPLKVVHRDISPQNILVSFDGSVKLVDFGIAKAADQASMTKSGAIKGKFAYMSPEQAAGKVLDHRSDLFAIGLVLYELLTGVRPLKRDSELATLQAALECKIEPPSAVADVPPELDPVVMMALAKAADDRYRDARAFQMALEEFLVSQRWVASSVQVSELMTMLFEDRLSEEAKLGYPDPSTQDSGLSGMPPPPPVEGEGQSVRTDRAASMEWEAPPGATQLSEKPERPGGRLSARGLAKAQPRKAPESQALTDSGVSSAPPVEVPDWEAPPAEELPATHSGELEPVRPPSNENATAIARSSSRPDVRRSGAALPRVSSRQLPTAEPLPDESLPPISEILPAVSRRSSRPSSPGLPARRSSLDLPRRPPSSSFEADPDDFVGTLDPAADPEPEPEPAPLPEPPPRRRSRSGEPKRRTSGRVRQRAPTPPPPLVIDKYVDLEELREKSRRRLVLVLGASAAAALILTMLLFREPILDVLVHREADNVTPVLLSVESSPRAKVRVRHPPAENARHPEVELGETPLRNMRGAHVGDTVILTNPDQGFSYEEEIPAATANQEVLVKKEFMYGTLRATVMPKELTNLTFWREGRQMGKYQPGLPISLYEGKHRLEVRGPQLKKPYSFEVLIKRNELTAMALNLNEHL